MSSSSIELSPLTLRVHLIPRTSEFSITEIEEKIRLALAQSGSLDQFEFSITSESDSNRENSISQFPSESNQQNNLEINSNEKNFPSLTLSEKFYFLCCLLLILFSLIFVLFPLWGEYIFYLMIYYNINGPIDHSPNCRNYSRLIAGILGAVMIGWGITLASILYLKIYSKENNQRENRNEISKNNEISNIDSNELNIIQMNSITRDSLFWIILNFPLLDWFFIDSAFSFATGYWQNVILNSLFIGSFLIPIVGMAPPNWKSLTIQWIKLHWKVWNSNN